jgi:hypothetical protein
MFSGVKTGRPAELFRVFRMSNVENMRHEKTIVFEYYDLWLPEKRYNGALYGPG